MPKLLILPGGGIGDMICSLPVVEWIADTFNGIADLEIWNCKDVEAYKAILGPREKWFKEIHSELPPNAIQADGHFILDEMPRIVVSPEFKETLPAHIISHFELWSQRTTEFGDAFHNQPYQNHLVSSLAIKKGLNRITLPQWCLGIEKPQMPFIAPSSYSQIKETKEKFSLPNNFITINDGWNETGARIRPTKSYPIKLWLEFISRALGEGYEVIQLGNDKTGSSLSLHGLKCLRGQTTFQESLDILTLSSCHIDIEGGLIHAATALRTPCIVLFGPTNPKFFGYEQNVNLYHGSCHDCYWLKPGWSMQCIANKSSSCMHHEPEIIMITLKQLLNRRKNYAIAV